jgi:2-polyprenyl-6-methoxyphenol hydroxylase-like FAD-dependent oxidoreductase
MTNAQTPVLVVGGRTTGLMMAAELARHGAPVRIIDKSSGINPHARATLLHSRTLEIFDGLGIADPIRDVGQPLRRTLLFANGKLVGQSNEAAVDSPFPHGLALSQAKTEAVMQQHLESLGAAVERNTELTAIQQRADGVRATIRHADGAEEIVDTPWLVGCDGAHSTVRHLTEESFPGEADPFPYLLADVIVDGALDPADAHIYLHDEGELFLFILDEGRRFVVASGPRGSEDRAAPTLEQMQQLVARRSQTAFRLSDPRWLARFHIHYRLAPHYRHGRTFLAGDAAHIHSLIGGLGMNTGIQDAYNLAWKLALVMRGVVPDSWLDTYELERRRVAEGVIATTRLATQNTEMFAALSQQQRTSLCEHMFAPEGEKTKARRQAEELDLDYGSSPLCSEPEGEFDAGPHAGAQVLNAAPLVVDDAECTFFDLLRGPRHRLLLFTGTRGTENVANLAEIAGRTAETHGHWIDVFVVCQERTEMSLPPEVTRIGDPRGSLHRRYDATAACLYLIRPDGHVACRSKIVDSLEKYFARVL